ncbi:hypothetical protein [Streptomyces sp. NPDC020742]|uniref:hypothetical protein n=1 Tax=Streptomyces sp. NPDC020742 TaxID=3154897 RepID=UPI0033FC669D
MSEHRSGAVGEPESSGGCLGVVVVIALVLGVGYATNQSFADGVSEDVPGDLVNAQKDDRGHRVLPHDKDPGGWITVPCWSAATRFTVLDRMGSAPLGVRPGGSSVGDVVAPVWRVALGPQQITFYDDENRTATPCASCRSAPGGGAPERVPTRSGCGCGPADLRDVPAARSVRAGLSRRAVPPGPARSAEGRHGSGG